MAFEIGIPFPASHKPLITDAARLKKYANPCGREVLKFFL